VADRLSALDTSFLHLEDATTPMHVGSVMVFDPPTSGFDYDRLVTLIAQRIAFVPRYRQRIREVPGRLANPVWVDDEDFDVTYHVRRSALPRPGSDEQLEELVARVNLAVRRQGGAAAAPGRWQVHDLVLDEDAHRVWRGEQEVQLTATEFTLLRCLITNAGRVVSRAQILDHVWQYDFAGESAIIESFVSTLRKKVDAAEPKLIHTVRGVGYSIREP